MRKMLIVTAALTAMGAGCLATVDAAQAQHWRGRGFGGWGGAHRGFGGFGGHGFVNRGFGYGGFGRLAVNRGYGGYYGGYYRPRGWGWGGFGAGLAAGALVGGLASGPAYGWGYDDDYYGYPAVATAPVVYETAPAPVVVRRVVYPPLPAYPPRGDRHPPGLPRAGLSSP